MPRPLPTLALAVTLALSCLLPAPAAVAAPVAASERFAFHGDPWINLHHLLYQWAVADEVAAARAEGDEALRRRGLWAVAVPERGELSRLSEAERRTWNDALRVYVEHAVDRNLLFDDTLWAFRNALATGDPGPAELAPLHAALGAAMPVYRRHWWPAHDAANRRWIADLVPLLVLHGDAAVRRLEEVYGGTWPADPVRVDVTAYANSVGAYTREGPLTITVASTREDYRAPRSFEMVHHEASHSDFFRPLRLLLIDVYDSRGVDDLPRDLVHALLFYTVAEVTRETLDGAGVTDGYVTYGEHVGLWTRGHWADLRAALSEHWQPYLDGTAERRAALERVATALAARDGAE